MKNPTENRPASSRSAFTLVEILLAVAILGIGFGVLLTGLSACLAAFRVSARFQEAQWVLGQGEALYPLRPSPDVLEDIPVPPDSSILEGYTFERIVEEDEDEDNLFVVHTRVFWRSGAATGTFDEVTQYIWQREE